MPTQALWGNYSAVIVKITGQLDPAKRFLSLFHIFFKLFRDLLYMGS